MEVDSASVSSLLVQGDNESLPDNVNTASEVVKICIDYAKLKQFDQLAEYLKETIKKYESELNKLNVEMKQMNVKFDSSNVNSLLSPFLSQISSNMIDSSSNSNPITMLNDKISKLRVEKAQLKLEMSRMKQQLAIELRRDRNNNDRNNDRNDSRQENRAMILDRIKKRLNDQVKNDNDRLYRENVEWEKKYKLLQRKNGKLLNENNDLEKKLRYENETNKRMSQLAMEMIDLSKKRERGERGERKERKDKTKRRGNDDSHSDIDMNVNYSNSNGNSNSNSNSNDKGKRHSHNKHSSHRSHHNHSHRYRNKSNSKNKDKSSKGKYNSGKSPNRSKNKSKSKTKSKTRNETRNNGDCNDENGGNDNNINNIDNIDNIDNDNNDDETRNWGQRLRGLRGRSNSGNIRRYRYRDDSDSHSEGSNISGMENIGINIDERDDNNDNSGNNDIDESVTPLHWTDKPLTNGVSAENINNENKMTMKRCNSLQRKYEKMCRLYNGGDGGNIDNVLIKIDKESIDENRIKFMQFEQLIVEIEQTIESFIKLNENKVYLFDPKLNIQKMQLELESQSQSVENDTSLFYRQSDIVEIYNIDENNNQGRKRLNGKTGLRTKQDIGHFTVLGQLCGNELTPKKFHKMYKSQSEKYYKHWALTQQVHFLTQKNMDDNANDHFWIDTLYCNCGLHEICQHRSPLTYINDCRCVLQGSDDQSNQSDLGLHNVELVGCEVNGWPMIFLVTIKPIPKGAGVWSHYGEDYTYAMKRYCLSKSEN